MDLREHQQRASRARWSKPEAVNKRLDALAAHIKAVVDSLPPLSDEQWARLAVLTTPAPDGRPDA